MHIVEVRQTSISWLQCKEWFINIWMDLNSQQILDQKKVHQILQYLKLIIILTNKNKKQEMVKLSFTVYVPAPLKNVWAYFSKFENVAKWDPNTTSVILKKETPNKVGSLYDVKTLFKGEEKQLEYKMIEYQQFKKIAVKGQNFSTSTVDEIIFEEKHPGTNVTYIADIQLRHVLKILTPFIKKDLDQLAKSAEQGFRDKSKQIFG